MAEDNELLMEEDAISLEDTSDSETQDVDVGNLVGYVQGQFKKAEDYREQDEDRWTRAYKISITVNIIYSSYWSPVLVVSQMSSWKSSFTS